MNGFFNEYLMIEAEFVGNIYAALANEYVGRLVKEIHGDPFGSSVWQWGNDGAVYIKIDPMATA